QPGDGRGRGGRFRAGEHPLLSAGAQERERSTMAMHLVTGGSGFVGANIARLLRLRGGEVGVLDIWGDEAMPADIEYVEADINDAEKVAHAMRGVDYVHHNVALVPLAKAGQRFWTVNVEGTRTALRAAKDANVKMFAHMSSSAVFGSPNKMPI